jgi:hypothetical protein
MPSFIDIFILNNFAFPKNKLKQRLSHIHDALPEYNFEQYEDDETNLLDYPDDGSILEKITYFVTFPLHFLFTITVPNVKKVLLFVFIH